jgi:hypothetical protein
MVPSIGGGTKRSETLRAVADAVGEGEGVSVGGEEVSIGDGVGVGDSWAKNVEVAQRLTKSVSLNVFVMSSGVETSLNISEQSKARQ